MKDAEDIKISNYDLEHGVDIFNQERKVTKKEETNSEQLLFPLFN